MAFTKEIKIALTAIVAVVALFFGMNFLKGRTAFSNSTTYKMTFSDLKGLVESTPIYANGYKVGSIREIQFDYEHVGEDITVLCDINPKLRIPVGTQAKIETDLMGNLKVSLVMGKAAAQRLKPGEVIEGSEQQGVMDQVNNMMPTLNSIVTKIDSITTNINIIMSDPSIRSAMQNIDGMTASLKFTTEEINYMMKELRGGVPLLMEHANNTMANAESLTGKLNDIDFNATMSKIDNTLSNVEAMTRSLNSTEGTIGLLLHDKTLYNNLSSLTGDADSLLIDLKAHPMRYVHFSLFGRKEKK